MIYNNKEVYGVIYKITNQINNKIYIGQTVNWDERYRHHRQEAYRKNTENAKRPIYRAIRKHGLKNFKFEIIDIADDKAELDNLEIYYIDKFNSLIDHNGYNLEKGGANGRKSEYTKRKISEAQKGEKNHMYGIKGKDNPTSKRTMNVTKNIIYDSITECALKEYGDIKYVKNISSVCNPKSNKFSFRGNIYCFIDDDGNYIKKETSKISFVRNVKIIDKKSNKIFNSISETAKYFNISTSMVRDRIYGRIKKDKFKDIFDLCLYECANDEA